MISEQILSKIIDVSPIPTFVINKNHQVVCWNKAIEALSGIKSEDIVGTKEQWKAFYAENRPVMADLIVDGGHLGEAEKYYLGKCSDSSLIPDACEAEDFFPALGESGRWLHFTASPLRDTDNNIIGAIETLQDITARKVAEEMLSKIVNGSPIPMFVINQKHDVVYWNTAIEVLSGIKSEEIIGTKQQWRAFYNHDRPVMADLIIDSASIDEIETYYHGRYLESTLIEGAYEGEDFSATLGTKGKWIHYTASPIKDKNGIVVGAIETIQDITQRKKAEKALLRSEGRFRYLFESAIDVILVHDLDGNIQMANNAAVKLTGYSVNELNRSNIAMLFTVDGLELVKKVNAKLTVDQDIHMPYQLKLIRKDGKELIVEMTSRLIKWKSQPFAFHMSARDITQEKKMQESLQYFLHQVLVAQEEERKRIARDLHDDTAQSLLLLIHKLDSLASMPAGRIGKQIKEELTKLYDLAVQTHRGFRHYIQELRPAIFDDLGLVAALEWLSDNLNAESGTDVDVQVDLNAVSLSKETELILFRIAQEALTNIKKHAGASKATIKLESNREKLRMIISDNGRGFEAPPSLSDIGSAGKLGLIGIKERVQLINGSMDIKSEGGRGTELVIEIPLHLT